MSAAVSGPRHVYHVGPWRRWMFAWIFGPVLLGTLAAWIFVPGDTGAVAGQVFLILLAFSLGGQWLIDRAQLEISPGGVVLRQTGYRLESPWTNIVEMRVDRGLEAFITREPAGGKGHALLAASAGTGALPIYDQRHLTLLNEHRLIPFEAFAWHLRRGEMRAQIESYAPHLRAALATLDAPKAAAPPRPPLSGKARLQIGTMIAVSLGIGWLALSSKVNRPLVDTIFGTMALLAVTVRSCYAARDFLRRRLWVWGAVLVVLAVAFGLWTLGMVMELAKVLGGPR